MQYTDFYKDIKKGKIGEQIFIEDFLKFLNINYEDVTGIQGFQIIDSDFLAKIGRYEIKATYKDDNNLCIEEYTNINKELGKISMGWFYKSKADMIVFISKSTRTMILLPLTEYFKNHYEEIKDNYKLRENHISFNNGNKWQSAYRKIPLKILSGYFAFYKRI
jgi:hypothetical protein